MSNGLTNSELVSYLGLPADIITNLQSEQSTTYTAAKNEFLESLFNKVIYSSVFDMDFTNPFKKYDGFPVKFGDSIENIFVPMPKGYKYNKDATDPFARNVTDVKAYYASINYEMQYESTIYDSLLRRACLNEFGFMNLIDTILGNLSKSMSIDEYFAQICLLNNPDLYPDGIEEVELPADASDTLKGATVTKAIVNAASSFQHPKDSNNKAAVMNVTKKENILLIIDYRLLNTINLDYLAGQFNLSKIDLIKNIITVDSFKVVQDNGTDPATLVGEDMDFIVMDEKCFDNHVALQDGGMIYNPKGKYTNHFYNLWKIMSFKLFCNARAFKVVTADTQEVSEPAVGD